MPDGEPDLRILQANERTLLAWIRTGLTLMAFGFVIARLTVWLRIEHPERGQDTVLGWLGTAIVALGTSCHVIGVLRFVSARRAILAGQPIRPGVAGPVAITVAVTAAGIVAVAYLAATTG